MNDLPYADVRDIVGLANQMEDFPGADDLTWLIECNEEDDTVGILVDGSTSVLAMDFAGKTAIYSSLDTYGQDPALPHIMASSQRWTL